MEVSMAIKKIDTAREEMRVLGDAANETAGDTNHWSSPEFWTMAGAALANLSTVAVLLGWMNQSDAQDLVKALTALLGATQVIVMNSMLVWKYVAGRLQMKTQIAEARMQCMAMVATERLRTEAMLAEKPRA
jgi:anti-sigma-K factor RskA